jgi:hypothetical protein
MTNVLSVDQSLGKCAWTIWSKGEALESGIFKSGNAKVKTKYEGVTYFDTTEEQIHFLASELHSVVNGWGASEVIFESLSFGSVGNATRDLACLYGALVERLISTSGIDVNNIYKVTPTTLKAFARKFLPEDEQFDGFTKAGKPKLVKMDKKKMVEAAIHAGGSPFLEGLKMSGKSAGLDDAADSFLLGLYFHKKLQ